MPCKWHQCLAATPSFGTFEAYLMLVPSSQITFEHAVLLINELARGEELRLGDCMLCGGLVVVDGLAIRDIRCSRCSEASQLHC